MSTLIPASTRHAAMAATLCLAAAAAGPAVAQTVVHFGPNEGYRPIYSPLNLVVNGDFNADPLVDPNNEFATNPNVTSWTISPPSEYPGTRNSNAGVGADGRGLSLGDMNLIDVSQTLDTRLGQTYQLSFFHAVDGEPGNLFRVYAGDTLLWNLDGVEYEIGVGWFHQYLHPFVASDTSTVLRFEYQSPRGFQYLSNVTVLPVPEPGTVALMLSGLAVVAAASRRRRSSVA